MKSKFMLLALSVFALALAALPAIASAGEPEIDSKSLNEGKTLSFTSKGEHAELRALNEPTITCTANEGVGKYNTKKTGEITLTFTGCKTPNFFNAECHSVGQSSGVIKTGTSVFHNTYLTDAKTTPGVLVTPPSGGVFATITCATFFTTTVAGNGIIGHLESPKCGASSTTGTLNFSATETTQNFRQVTGTGTIYSLTATTSGGEPRTAAEIAEGTVTYAETATVTCV
jgi:hypothetical protein